MMLAAVCLRSARLRMPLCWIMERNRMTVRHTTDSAGENEEGAYLPGSRR